ncbi:jun-like transcription factor [Extremus antarcticus]|uniref:Jun-like transcription factor n=1 Tax=Extremus antarcticus TaxID=702011 RepID=A0AAJ0DFM4_9PEZI|nr:jun-like transcription factor [Extremus antarcticus]
MARKAAKSTEKALLKRLWPAAWGPAPPQDVVLGQIAGFLGDLGFTESRDAVIRQAKDQGVVVGEVSTATNLPEEGLLKRWKPESASNASVKKEDSSSEGDSSSDEEAAEGGALVDGKAEKKSEPAASTKPGLKRKRSETPSSSDDSSSSSESEADNDAMNVDTPTASDSSTGSSSDSSEDERPVTKKTKISHVTKKSVSSKSSSSGSSSSGSSSSSTSESSSDSGSGSKKSKSSVKSKKSANSKSSSSGSSSSSSSASSSSESDSGSSSSSSSDSEPEPAPRSPSPVKAVKKEKKKPKQKMIKKIEVLKTDSKRDSVSSSSATLGAEDPAIKHEDTLLVPTADPNDDTLQQIPATKENVKKLKKDMIPFSRIPADQKVDPRFSSNNYVSYDYADRAYQDLSVTKGKGFTKEKNKKKRGESTSASASTVSSSDFTPPFLYKSAPPKGHPLSPGCKRLGPAARKYQKREKLHKQREAEEKRRVDRLWATEGYVLEPPWERGYRKPRYGV